MENLLEELVGKIEERDPLHGKKVRKNIVQYDAVYFEVINAFLKNYTAFLRHLGKDLEYGVDCYMQWLADFRYQHLRFMESGAYMSKSFDEVNTRVYGNPEIMRWYYHGLLISQALWDQHYAMFSFFIKNLPEYRDGVTRYLEIGGGHGLFISEATKLLKPSVAYSLLDISPTAIEMSRQFIEHRSVQYILTDIFKFQPEGTYDFITLGEVLEHVEEPLKLLHVIRNLLSDRGTVFITVPANAPTMDHISLFRNADEIRSLLKKAGFTIEKEVFKYAEDLPAEKLEKYKVTLEYGAFLKKKG